MGKVKKFGIGWGIDHKMATDNAEGDLLIKSGNQHKTWIKQIQKNSTEMDYKNSKR